MGRGFIIGTCLASLLACAPRAEPLAAKAAATRSLRLAFAPGRCALGNNVVGASASVGGAREPSIYLKPTDGTLRFELLVHDRATPVSVRWLDVPPARDTSLAPLAPPSWNLELSFVSPVAGECPIRVDFEPSPKAAAEGLGPALTTIVLKDAPLPPVP